MQLVQENGFDMLDRKVRDDTVLELFDVVFKQVKIVLQYILLVYYTSLVYQVVLDLNRLIQHNV